MWRMHVGVAMLLGMMAFAFAARGADAPRRPNVLLILADDVGFSDLGCYGSEIQTPTLDKLASEGLRLTQFYNCARCCPSRATLLTGQYAHAVNFPNMSGSLPDTCVTLAEVMKSAGYRTYMTGKWHLGMPGPVMRGFEEYFGMLGGYGSFWNPALYSRRPADHPTRQYAKGAFYSTDVFTDYALDFIADARRSDKPWFLYLAYNAAHFPLHAPKEDIARYAELYQQGWDAIRAKRCQRLKELKMIDGAWELSPRSIIPPNAVANKHDWANKENPAWDTIDAPRRADLARRMAVYAAMIDHMDRQIARVVADLAKNHEIDNTVIFFLSDNGACAEWDPWGFDTDSGPNNILHTGAALDAIGAPGSYVSYGSGWANACNTPFRLYKHYSHEGGISTPFIVHWPAGMSRKNELDSRPAHLIDLMPTLVDLAGAAYPKDVAQKPIMPMAGRSLLPAIKNTADAPRAIFFEHEGNKAVRQGQWKLVSLKGEKWELYDMEKDRIELHDLAAANPQKAAELAALWSQWAQQMHIGDKSHAQPGKRNAKPSGFWED